ncbi:TPA: hypothetical protein N0F65_001766 [Lagenidium giganteum]|uniref:Zinc finger C2H2 LYAR-type domain-containing protein n=1 Tax=Lagenidium giganteum TaxID=4803 RepID=A0AAV2Z1C2_9STRA|nr:TPA: hypothetical protein N0F65_001766 [Lagenidium giganteum]
MVFFVCEGCNESLKKNKVDQHASRCRNCWAVSCVDCSVVFEGNDYAAHTTCMSEAQKYEKSLYKEKNHGNGAKKASPQERWMEVVQTAKAPGDAKLQNVLDRVAGYDNVPRKKNKFVNFMKNSIGMADANTVEKVWAVFDKEFQASQPEATPAATNGNNSDAAADSKKRTEREDGDAESDAKKQKTSKEGGAEKPVKWAKLIKAALKDAANKELDMTTLRDQIVQSVLDKKLSTKHEKELKKEFKAALEQSDKFQVVEVVRLA